jgi:hypothetical protein
MVQILEDDCDGQFFPLLLLLESSPEESGLLGLYSDWTVGFTTKGSCLDSWQDFFLLQRVQNDFGTLPSLHWVRGIFPRVKQPERDLSVAWNDNLRHENKFYSSLCWYNKGQ